jgi:hypothetical protein
MEPMAEQEDDSIANVIAPLAKAEDEARVAAEANAYRESLGQQRTDVNPKVEAFNRILEAEGNATEEPPPLRVRIDNDGTDDEDGSWARINRDAEAAGASSAAFVRDTLVDTVQTAKETAFQVTAGAGSDIANVAYDGFSALGKLVTYGLDPERNIGQVWGDTFGTTENNPVEFPQSDMLIPALARVIPEWLAVTALVKRTPVGAWAEATGLGAGFDLPQGASRLRKVWNSPFFRDVIPGAVADMVLSATGDNMHALMADKTGVNEEGGSGSSAWDAYVKFMASTPGTDAGTVAENAWKAALEGMEFSVLLAAMGSGLSRTVGGAQTVRKALYSLTESARNYRSLRTTNPQAAAAGRDAAQAMAANASTPPSNPRGVLDPLDDPAGPLMDRGEPGAAPSLFGEDEPTGGHPAVYIPKQDRKLLEGMRDPNVTAEGDVSAEQYIQDINVGIEAAYAAGGIKSSSIIFRAYSRDLWRKWSEVNALQDNPLTTRQMKQLKRQLDAQAVAWSNEVGQPAELYYRYKFGDKPSENWRAVMNVDELGPNALRQVYETEVTTYHGTAPGVNMHREAPDARKSSWLGKAAHGLYTAGQGYAFTYSSGEVMRVKIPKGTRFLNMESRMSTNPEDYANGVKLAIWSAEEIAKDFPTTVSGKDTLASDLVKTLKELAYGTSEPGPETPLLDGNRKLWDIYEPLFDWAHGSHLPPRKGAGPLDMPLNAKTGEPSDPQAFFEQYIQRPIREYGYDVIEEAEPASARHGDGSMVRIIIDPTDNLGIGRTARLKIDPVAPPGGQRVVTVATNLHNAAKKEGPKKFYSFVADTVRSVAKDVLGDSEKLLLVDPSDLDPALPPLAGTPAHGTAPVGNGRPTAPWTAMPDRNLHAQVDGLARAATAGNAEDEAFASFHFTYASDLTPQQVGEAADEIAMRLRDKWVKKMPMSQPPAVGYVVTGDFPDAVHNMGHGQVSDSTWVMSSEYRSFARELEEEDLVFIGVQMPDQAALPLTEQGTYKALVEAGVPSYRITAHPTDGIYVLSPAGDQRLRTLITDIMETSPYRAGDPAASLVKRTGGRYDITDNLADSDWRSRGFAADTRGPAERKAERAYYAQQASSASGDVPSPDDGWDWGDLGGGNDTLYQRDGGGGEALGGYTVDPATGRSIIGLTKQANYSTWLHELSHAFFDDLPLLMGDAADEVYAWAGVPSKTPFNQWPVEAKEKWARAFERYAYEGKADTPAARGALAAQARWMRQVYGSTLPAELNVPMPDKVRDMIAQVMVGAGKKIPRNISFTRRTSDGHVWINHERIESEEDIDGVMQAIADSDKPIVDYATGEVLTLEMVKRKAAAANMTVPQLLGMSPYMSPENALRARQLEVASAETLVRLADVARNSTDPEDLYRFRRAITVHRAINAKNRAISRAASRSLGSRRVIAHSSKARMRAIEDMIANEGADNLRSLADEVSALSKHNPGGLDNYLTEIDKASKWDAFHEVFVNNLLTSPKTHLVNTLGNSATIALTMTHAVAAATIDRVLHGGKNIDMREVGEMTNGVLRGVTDGWKFAKAAFEDAAVLDYGKGSVESAGPGAKHGPAFVPETFGRKSVEKFSDDPISWGIDALGRMMRTPTRALRSSDAFFFTVNYRMELHRLAHRDAMKAFEASNGAMTQKEVADRMARTLASPPEDMLDKAIRFGKKQTFTSEIGGRAGRWMSQAAGVPGFRKVFPFMRTPVNIFKYAFENTPLAPVSADFRARLNSQDAGEAAIAKAQLGIATLMFFAVGDAVDKGIITGGYSMGQRNAGEKRSQQRSGQGQYSIGGKLDGPRIPFNRIEPIGSAVSMAADVWQAIDKASDSASNELAVASVLHLADAMTSKTYMKNFADIVEALQDGDYDRLTPVIVNTATAHVPMTLTGLASALKGVADPTMRDTKVTGEENYAQGVAEMMGTGGAQTVYRLINEVWAKIPGLSDDLPAAHDLWGREISFASPMHDTYFGKAYEFMSPVQIQRSSDPQVREIEQILQRNRLFPEQPERQIDDVRLTAKEYEEYAKDAGQAALKRLRADLPYLRSLPDDGPEGEKAEWISSVISEARKTAADKFRDRFPYARTKAVEERKTLSSKRQWGMSAQSLEGIKRP